MYDGLDDGLDDVFDYNQESYYGNPWNPKELYVLPIMAILRRQGGSVDVQAARGILGRMLNRLELLNRT